MITENELPRQLELYEILELVGKTNSRTEKKEILKKHDAMFLRDYLRCCFDDSIQFNLPDGPAPYTPAREESYPASWRREHVHLRWFVKGLSDKVPAMKRESVYLGILESVHPQDALILEQMVEKKCPTKGLTKKLVQEVFPKLIKE
jgi:hypothetical protein